MPLNSPEYRRAYYLANREKLIAQTKAWTDAQTPEQKEATRIRKLEWARNNSHKNIESRREKALQYYYANRESVLAKKKAIRDADPDFGKKIYAKRKPEEKGKATEWRKANPEKWKKLNDKYRLRRNELSKQRRAENPTRKLAENCRSRIRHILKREQVTKSQPTFKFIGCTAEFFREFLEAQFTPAMTWQNYGIYWVVDHVIPIASFDLHDPEKLKHAFHYSNCRPLCAIANSVKCDTLPGSHQPYLV